jgi:hypothetical protein
MRVLISLLILLVTFETSAAQTIADIARKERERQKQIQHQNSKTFTNVTPTGTPSNPPQTATAVEKKESPPAPVSSGPTDNKGRDEKYWRTAFQTARENAKRADENAQILDLKIKELNMQLLRQSDIYNRENRIGPELTATQIELDSARREAEQARQKIADLEEELRRSNGPAGWAR